LAGLGHGDVDMVALQHTTRDIGSVAFALAQAGDGGCLVAERGQKLERELRAVERLRGKV